MIDDPFAEPLVRAVGVDFFTRLATGELTPADLDGGQDGESPVGMSRFADGMAARTRFFDDFFAAAVRGRQSGRPSSWRRGSTRAGTA